MATQKRNLKGNRNSDGDFMSVDAMDALVMSTQDMIDAGIPVHEQMVQMDEPPRYMDDPDPTLEADIEDLKIRIEARGLDTPAEREFLETVKEEVKDERPGWKKAKGGGFWSVDWKSPYWQTEEGYQESLKVWGKKPGWIKRPSAKKEKVDFKPTKRISL